MAHARAGRELPPSSKKTVSVCNELSLKICQLNPQVRNLDPSPPPGPPPSSLNMRQFEKC
eukprot:1175683-Prorocentrum_minimum.AAC.4